MGNFAILDSLLLRVVLLAGDGNVESSIIIFDWRAKASLRGWLPFFICGKSAPSLIFSPIRRTETAQISNPKGKGASIQVTTYFSGGPPTVKVSLPTLAETSLLP
jgi:hypothetical protein